MAHHFLWPLAALLLPLSTLAVPAELQSQSLKPAASFDSYAVFQQAASQVEGSSEAQKASQGVSEFAVCKASVGSACANSRLHCPAACVQGFYGGGNDRNYGEGCSHARTTALAAARLLARLEGLLSDLMKFLTIT
ncbi:hypothetical protein GOP47_0008418 [Adiantum capillus-veneris]|uniref:Uncharacterized protein n=1 Tax=Adiantum capillus-veneris TaxID=13818 RepID=A0A9D4UZA1_ADICA|nr:hypothetical protein GOP47_0008418 [Adiantum capillus-veneris]